MRKDSEKFLEILLKMRAEQGTDHFAAKISDFKDIPNISTNCSEILKDLKRNNCISERSNLNIIGEMKIYLTLDGIEYFQNKKEIEKMKSSVTIKVSDNGQVNFARDNGIVYAIQSSNLSKEDYNTAQKQNQFGISKKDTEVKKKKVFISYSWVPESNKAWVINLANRLELDGVEVVVDYKDLKLGHDIYSFMQRTVNDDTIDKVLIICNSEYKYKADNRQGGVGDESAIITPQVYGNATQEKFIPVVNEKNEEGKPFLPNYLIGRLYADLTDFENGYNELLKNISEEQSQSMVKGVKIKKSDNDIENYVSPTSDENNTIDYFQKFNIPKKTVNAEPTDLEKKQFMASSFKQIVDLLIKLGKQYEKENVGIHIQVEKVDTRTVIYEIYANGNLKRGLKIFLGNMLGSKQENIMISENVSFGGTSFNGIYEAKVDKGELKLFAAFSFLNSQQLMTIDEAVTDIWTSYIQPYL